jgi:glycine cleavage system regulatory protein
MITNSMEPHEESELVSLAEDYANAIRAWDKQQLLGRFVVQSRQDIVNYVGSLLAAKDAEIARLKAHLDSIRVAHDEAQAVMSLLNPDPTVATFQIAAHFQTMGNKVGRILQDKQDA